MRCHAGFDVDHPIKEDGKYICVGLEVLGEVSLHNVWEVSLYIYGSSWIFVELNDYEFTI